MALLPRSGVTRSIAAAALDGGGGGVSRSIAAAALDRAGGRKRTYRVETYNPHNVLIYRGIIRYYKGIIRL